MANQYHYQPHQSPQQPTYQHPTYQHPSPYVTMPQPLARPRMFGGPLSRVVWTVVPVLTLGFLAPLPFVVAAVKGVVAWWLALTYIVNTVVLLALVMVTPENESISGLLLILLMATAATHTALLDNPRVSVGK